VTASPFRPEPQGDGDGSPASRDLRAAVSGPLAQRLSPRYLEQHCLMPLDTTDDGAVRIAVGAPLDETVLDELRLAFEVPVVLVEMPAEEIQAAIISLQSSGGSLGAEVLTGLDVTVVEGEDEALDDLRTLASQAPVIKLVNLMLLDALKHRASDVHIESGVDGLRVRQRIDGVLHDMASHPRQYQAAVVSRIKIMANLNIAERRVPQDGRIRLRLSDREIDVRVSTMPTVHGESVVLRLLDQGGGARNLTDLGMDEDTRARFVRLVERPNGIVLVTGPTGSGKTTTLYAALQRINSPDVKIVTVEDPVEYQLEGLTQIPVNPKAGRTFAGALRSILRHDPDVIMVGEMRDRETAEIAIQAALTGHLVFSTLHTNDAPGGITRLLDMGIEPYLVMRTICDGCRRSHKITAEDRRRVAENAPDLVKPRFRIGDGCLLCANTGYRGRTGIYEVMTMTEGLRSHVVSRASLDDIRREAAAGGMVPLQRAAWLKAAAGVTTIAEVLRVTREETLL
jgi:general secretion pathway protein E